MNMQTTEQPATQPSFRALSQSEVDAVFGALTYGQALALAWEAADDLNAHAYNGESWGVITQVWNNTLGGDNWSVDLDFDSTNVIVSNYSS